MNRIPLKKNLFFLLKLAILAGLLWLVCWREGTKILSVFAGMNPFLPLLTGLCIFTQVALSSWRWRLLLKCRDMDIGAWQAFRLTFLGCFATLFVPGGAVGGDVVKAAFLASHFPKGEKIGPMTSIAVDRIAGMTGLFSIALILAGIFAERIVHFPKPLPELIGVLCLVCLAGLAGAVVAFFPDFFLKRGILRGLFLFANRVLKGVPERITEALSAYRSHWKRLIALSLLSGFVFQPLLIGAFLIPLYGVSEKPPVAGHAAAAAIFGQTASVLPVTPGGIGTRDLVAKEISAAFGVEPAAAAAAVLTYTAMMVLIYMLSGILYFFEKKEKTQ